MDDTLAVSFNVLELVKREVAALLGVVAMSTNGCARNVVPLTRPDRA